MTPETRVTLIHIAESVERALKQDTFNLTEADGREIIQFVRKVVNPSPVEGACTMAQACRILGVSEPTLRKYVKLGTIPEGFKVPNIQGKLWDEKKLRAVANDFRKKRKTHKSK